MSTTDLHPENPVIDPTIDAVTAPPADQVPLTPVDPVADPVPASQDTTTEPDPETFPREYVQRLRQEAADARVKVKDRDSMATRLHGALVTATGKLADPTDLAFDQAHLDDPEALTAAVDDLLSRKPHLASRRPSGDAGQGPRGSAAADVDLASILRSRAG